MATIHVIAVAVYEREREGERTERQKALVRPFA